MRYLTIIIILLTQVGICSAMLPPPPVVKEVPTQQYLKSLYDNHNVITVINSSPNGTRQGASGEIVVVANGGTVKLWVNRGGTVWTQF